MKKSLEEKLETILLDVAIDKISVKVSKTKILKLIENEKQNSKNINN